MKKLVWLVAVLTLVGFSAPVQAKDDAAAAEKKAEMKKMVEERKAELNGSEWKVKMTSNDPAVKPDDDLLTFQNTQIKSKLLTDRGFVPTNYTVTVEPGNEWAVWETMQTSAKEGVVFIRGEWLKDQMRGVISQQMEGGKTRDYNFTTVGKVAVPPTTPKPVKKEEPKPAPVAAAEEAAPAEAGAAEAAKTEVADAVKPAAKTAVKTAEKAAPAASDTAKAVAAETSAVAKAETAVAAPAPAAPAAPKKKKRWGF